MSASQTRGIYPKTCAEHGFRTAGSSILRNQGQEPSLRRRWRTLLSGPNPEGCDRPDPQDVADSQWEAAKGTVESLDSSPDKLDHSSVRYV